MGEPRSVLDGAVRLLRALPHTSGERQITHLSELTQLPRPTVHRLLAQLRDNGLAEWHNGRWMLGTAVVQIARHVEPFPGLRSAASPVLQTLRDATGAAVSLVVPDGPAFMALDMIPGRFALPIEAQAGAYMPPDSAAALALSPHDKGSAERARPFQAAIDQEHLIPGLTCYATAVQLPGGQRVALQIATPPTRLAERHAAAVHHAKAGLRKALSAQRTAPGATPWAAGSLDE